MNKTCRPCGAVKSLDEFYSHPAMPDGTLNKCKECTKARIRNHRLKNLDYFRWYDRIRAKQPHRILERQRWVKLNTEKANAIKKEWANRNRLKVMAERKVAYAIKMGKIKPLPCEHCGAKAQAHHPDYSKPLDVIWLCPKHHAEMHVALRDANRKKFEDTRSKKTKRLLAHQEKI